MTVDSVQQTCKGALLDFLADNLAINDLGGFKLSHLHLDSAGMISLTPTLASGYNDDDH